MKNKEKYAKEIVETACNGDSIAVTKEGERVVQCGNIACSECLFARFNCVEKIREWAESEYIESRRYQRKTGRFWIILNVINILQEITLGNYMHIHLCRQNLIPVG